jgi:hypothetical protein
VIEVTIQVDADGAAAEAESLCGWINAENDAGHAALVRGRADPHQLGVVTDVLTVALGPGGIAVALASVLVSWIRRRSGECTIKITRPDGAEYELSLTNVRLDDASKIREIVEDTTRFLEGSPPRDDGEGDRLS